MTFVSNGALVTKTPVWAGSISTFQGMPGMSSSGQFPTVYGGMYERQLWVFVLVNKRAVAVSRLPLPVYLRGEQGSRERLTDHPLAQLLEKPNPQMSGWDLWMWTSSTRDTWGEAYWYKHRMTPGGKVIALFPLHPANLHHDEEKGWSFDNGRLRLPSIDDNDLVKFRAYNPNSLMRGMSPLEPLRATLENEWSARTATSSFWKRGARPGYAISHPRRISMVAQTRLKAQMDAAHGGADKTGETLVLEEGMTAAKLDLSAEEAQYVETRKLNREEVCAAYDTPPPVVHILDNATFSNITEQMRSMYRDTMGGILPGYEASIQRDLVAAEFGGEDIYVEFLLDEVLRGDFEKRQEALNKATHLTIAEKRRMDNLPFIEGTDRIFMNTATMPLDAIDAAAGLPAQQVAEAAVRSVLGRLSWQTDLADVDPGVLVRGLDEADTTTVTKAYLAEVSAAGTVAGLRDRIRAIPKEQA